MMLNMSNNNHLMPSNNQFHGMQSGNQMFSQSMSMQSNPIIPNDAGANQGSNQLNNSRQMSSNMQQTLQMSSGMMASSGMVGSNPPSSHLISTSKPFTKPWQSQDHYGTRQSMVERIISLLKQRRPNASDDWHEKLPQMAKRLEEALYSQADDFNGYADTNTLKARLQQLALAMGKQSKSSQQNTQGNLNMMNSSGQGIQSQSLNNQHLNQTQFNNQMSQSMMNQQNGYLMPSAPGNNFSLQYSNQVPSSMQAHNMMQFGGLDGQMNINQQQYLNSLNLQSAAGQLMNQSGMLNNQSMKPEDMSGLNMSIQSNSSKSNGRQSYSASNMNAYSQVGMMSAQQGLVMQQNQGAASNIQVGMMNNNYGIPHMNSNAFSQQNMPSALMGNQSQMMQQGVGMNMNQMANIHSQLPMGSNSGVQPHSMLPSGGSQSTQNSNSAQGGNSSHHTEEHRRQVLKQQQQRLLLLRHASKCPYDNGKCQVTPHCANMKSLWKHIMSCKDQECKIAHCVSSRYVLSHYSKCKDQQCPVCGPVREAIRKNYEKTKEIVDMSSQQGNIPGGYLSNNASMQTANLVGHNSLGHQTTHGHHGSRSKKGDNHNNANMINNLMGMGMGNMQFSDINVTTSENGTVSLTIPIPVSVPTRKPTKAQLKAAAQAEALLQQQQLQQQQLQLHQQQQLQLQQLQQQQAVAAVAAVSSALQGYGSVGGHGNSQHHHRESTKNPLSITIQSKAPKSIYPLDLISCGIYSFSNEQIASHFKTIHEGMKLSAAKIKEYFLPVVDEILKSSNASNIFGYPVDPVLLNLPDYFEIVKLPMDLGTIRKRLEASSYRDVANFVFDVHLTFNNAMLYNPKGTDVYELAKKLKKDFDNKHKSVMLEIERIIELGRDHPDSCLICGEIKLLYEPPVYYCNGRCGGQRIRRTANFYSAPSNNYHWCNPCYNELKENQVIKLPDGNVNKSELNKKKHDENSEEPWVQCEGPCGRWVHQICGLFNSRRNTGDEVHFVCPNCLTDKRLKASPNEIIVAPSTKKMKASDLPHCNLSQFIEKRIYERLELAYNETAEKRNIRYNDVEKCPSLFLRQVSCYDKQQQVREGVLERYKSKNYPSEFPCRTKCLILFQNIDGQDVILFGMYVYEYGHKCPQPNHRRVYISYLDSVHYFRPRQYRTLVYHEILISYLDYVKARGFHTAHIWACPPQKGDDYILYVHPPDQKTPRADKLRNWYAEMLQESKKRGIVQEITDLHTEFLANPSNDATVLPYFEGDYWVNEAEVVIKDLTNSNSDDIDEDLDDPTGYKSKRKSKSKRSSRIEKPQGFQKSERDSLMAKLASIIEPMKDTFFVARLHPKEYAEKCALMRDAELLKENTDSQVAETGKEKQLQDEALSNNNIASDIPSVPDGVKKEGIALTSEVNDAKNDEDISNEQNTQNIDSEIDVKEDNTEEMKDNTNELVIQVSDEMKVENIDDDKEEVSVSGDSTAVPISTRSKKRKVDSNAPSPLRKTAKDSFTFESKLENEDESDAKIKLDSNIEVVDINGSSDDKKENLVESNIVEIESKEVIETSETIDPKEDMKLDEAEAKDTTEVLNADVIPSSEGIKNDLFCPVPIDKDDTEDVDDVQESEHFDTRQSVLNLCQGNHYQFDQLRRAKHTSMMVLYHIHNPDAPKFVPTCHHCHKDLIAGVRYRCESCDVDYCQQCIQQLGSKIHAHPLRPQPIQSNTAPQKLTEEQRKERARSIQLHMQLLAHAANCNENSQCVSKNCVKMKVINYIFIFINSLELKCDVVGIFKA